MERQRRKCYSTTSFLTGCTRIRNAPRTVTLCQAVGRVNHIISEQWAWSYVDILALRPEQSGPNVLCVMRECVCVAFVAALLAAATAT